MEKGEIESVSKFLLIWQFPGTKPKFHAQKGLPLIIS